ncbi:hypothetical protein AAG906_032875 [Vitis piasezkii]
MYTSYAKNKTNNWEVKASGHSVTIVVHGFHMDKGNNKQIVKLKEKVKKIKKFWKFLKIL